MGSEVGATDDTSSATAIAYEDFSRAYDRVIVEADLFESPEYYRIFKSRYWNTLRYVQRCLAPGARRVLDIGSGQFALLCRLILDLDCDVADIDSRHTQVLEQHGIGFCHVDLTSGGPRTDRSYDLVIMAEVIEHVPRPPHLVFRDLAGVLVPGGAMIVTTPNLYRLRNVVRMIGAGPIFCNFTFPEPDQSLGHFIEYSLEQMVWQLETAGLAVEHASLEQLDRGGVRRFARWARRAATPLLALRPQLRDNLVLIARKPA